MLGLHAGCGGQAAWATCYPRHPAECRASVSLRSWSCGWAVGSGRGRTPAADGVPLRGAGRRQPLWLGEWGVGPGPRLHRSGPRAASMPGNFTLIRENKGGAGGWGWGMALPHSRAEAGGRGEGEMPGWGRAAWPWGPLPYLLIKLQLRPVGWGPRGAPSREAQDAQPPVSPPIPGTAQMGRDGRVRGPLGFPPVWDQRNLGMGKLRSAC